MDAGWRTDEQRICALYANMDGCWPSGWFVLLVAGCLVWQKPAGLSDYGFPAGNFSSRVFQFFSAPQQYISRKIEYTFTLICIVYGIILRLFYAFTYVNGYYFSAPGIGW